MCITFTRARAMDDRIVLTGEVMGLPLIVRTPEKEFTQEAITEYLKTHLHPRPGRSKIPQSGAAPLPL